MQLQGLLIPLGIIVVMSVLGYLTQMLKRASDQRMMERDRERARERRANAAANNPSGQNDLDRYIRAVEAQRQKPIPTARPVTRTPPVPVAQPTRRKKKVEERGTDFPPEKKRGGTSPVVPASDELPVAAVVTPRGSVPTAARYQAPEKVATLTASRSTRSDSPFGLRLTALLSNPDATALAVVLHEVLGPPKSRQTLSRPPQPVVPPPQPEDKEANSGQGSVESNPRAE